LLKETTQFLFEVDTFSVQSYDNLYYLAKKFHKQQYCPLVIYTPRVTVKKLMNNKSQCNFVIEQTFPFKCSQGDEDQISTWKWL